MKILGNSLAMRSVDAKGTFKCGQVVLFGIDSASWFVGKYIYVEATQGTLHYAGEPLVVVSVHDVIAFSFDPPEV